jgi:hypothetical protein
LSEAFVPRSERWRRAALSRGVALIDQAIEVLRHSPTEDAAVSPAATGAVRSSSNTYST